MSIGGSKGTSAAEKTYMAGLQQRPDVYTGQRVAGFNPMQQQYFGAAQQFAGAPSAGEQAVGGIASGAQGINTSALQEQYGYQSTPYVQQQAQDAAQQALSGITSRYAGAGRLGSGAFGEAAGRGVTAAMAPVLSQAAQADAQRRASLASQLAGYSQSGLGLQLQSAPMAQQMELQRLQTLGGVGGQQQALEQAQLEANQQAVAEQNAAQMGYLNQLQQASAIKQQRRQEDLNRWLGAGQAALGLGLGFMGVPTGGLGGIGGMGGMQSQQTTQQPMTFGQRVQGGLLNLAGSF